MAFLSRDILNKAVNAQRGGPNDYGVFPIFRNNKVQRIHQFCRTPSPQSRLDHRADPLGQRRNLISNDDGFWIEYIHNIGYPDA